MPTIRTMADLQALFPDAAIESSTAGDLVIYTGLRTDPLRPDGPLIPHVCPSCYADDIEGTPLGCTDLWHVPNRVPAAARTKPLDTSHLRQLPDKALSRAEVNILLGELDYQTALLVRVRELVESGEISADAAHRIWRTT